VIGFLIGIGHDCAGWDAQHFDSLLPQPSVPAFVMDGLISHPMDDSIDLDRQLRHRTIEVENIRS
jgi:hypothetical protein